MYHKTFTKTRKRKRIGERVTGKGKMKNGNKRKIVKERSHRVRV